MVVTMTTFGCPEGAWVKAGGNGAVEGGEDPKSLDTSQKNVMKPRAIRASNRGPIRRSEFTMADLFGLEAYGGGCEALRPGYAKCMAKSQDPTCG
jgi:hypothetical protein